MISVSASVRMIRLSGAGRPPSLVGGSMNDHDAPARSTDV
jgi:hypothetical protein